MWQRVSNLTLLHFKQFFTELLRKKNPSLYTVSWKIPWRNILNYHFGIFLQLINKYVKSNSFLTIWYDLRPSQQPTVWPKYSQSIKTNFGASDGRMIILSSHRPTILYWRLSNFTSWHMQKGLSIHDVTNKGSKIDTKLLVHISKKSEPMGRDLSKNQEKMLTSNMDDQNLLVREGQQQTRLSIVK